MTTPDYRTFTDAELADCQAAIEQVRRDRRAIATEEEFAAIHERAAADSLAAAERVRAEADAARARQNIHTEQEEG